MGFDVEKGLRARISNFASNIQNIAESRKKAKVVTGKLLCVGDVEHEVAVAEDEK